MKSTRRIFPWLALALILTLVWIFWPREIIRPPADAPDIPRQSSREKSPDFPQNRGNPQNPPIDSPAKPDQGVASLIERSLVRFQASGGPEESTAILRELRDGIRAADEPGALAAIVDFLKSNRDANTGLPFVVGPEGMMETTPTLRIALLDLLPSLDPMVALEIARSIMDGKKSPDEYALGLRNLTWNDLDGDLIHELSDRLEQMIEVEEWRAIPSAGFLEGLDAAVEIASERTFEMMVRLNGDALKDSSLVLSRAAFVALDRMVLRNPVLLVEAFARDPDLPGFSPDQRASLMSRLDLADRAQRESFSKYLSDPSRSSAELEYFINLFPNGNYLHGNWLITSGETPRSIDSRLQEDRKTLARIEEMITSSPSQQANQAIVRVRDRLKMLTATPIQK